MPVDCVTPLSPPSRIILPSLSTKLFASRTPLLLSTCCVRASAALAVIITRPPSALISPLFSARASTAAWSTVRLIRPSPLKSIDTWFPAAKVAVPPGVVMVPSLLTFGPISATTPPGMALSRPWLITGPALPELLKLYFPAKKSLSSILSVEAVIPPTSTRAVLPKITPAGFTRNTLPFAESEPIIWVGFWSVMRFNAEEAAFGWLNCTAALEPMLKLFQFAIICWLA